MSSESPEYLNHAKREEQGMSDVSDTSLQFPDHGIAAPHYLLFVKLQRRKLNSENPNVWLKINLLGHISHWWFVAWLRHGWAASIDNVAGEFPDPVTMWPPSKPIISVVHVCEWRSMTIRASTESRTLKGAFNGINAKWSYPAQYSFKKTKQFHTVFSPPKLIHGTNWKGDCSSTCGFGLFFDFDFGGLVDPELDTQPFWEPSWLIVYPPFSSPLSWLGLFFRTLAGRPVMRGRLFTK